MLGAGASGLVCAWQAAERGRRVVLLERLGRPGRRLLATGGGRCNFTNRSVDFSNYLSENPRFAISALSRFTPRRVLEWLGEAEIAYEERELGQLFCRCSAAELLALLEERNRRAGVDLQLGCQVQSIERRSEGGFEVHSHKGSWQAERLVLATGGLSAPRLGGNPLGLEMARGLGLPVVPPRPALVPLTWSAADRDHYGDLTGISTEVSAQTGFSPPFRANLLFTHRGLSGPAILQVSSYWRAGQAVQLDWLPGLDLGAELAHAKLTRPKTTLRRLLCRHLPRRLVLALEAQGLPTGSLGQQADSALQQAAQRLSSWELRPAGTEGYKSAEVTAGGVDTRALSSRTMEALTFPGLYVTGELVDMTGWLGGYNLHWAWASGWCAGQAV